MNDRVKNSVDKFHNVFNLENKEIVDLAKIENIDIAIDLNGYTDNSRTGIFAERAAPIQINYLGYTELWMQTLWIT